MTSLDLEGASVAECFSDQFLALGQLLVLAQAAGLR
jgi:hypothetical protein